jgi:aminoglycoside phosphotransferase (APT) family kinase protein
VPDWPAPLARAVADVVGGAATRTPLPGLSGSAVELVEGPRERVVVKRASSREVAFYASVVPALPSGVRVPHAWWAADGWLVLEHVPSALPRHRWLADPDVLAVLVALHAADVPPLDDPFVPCWSDELTERALALLPVAVGPALQRFQGSAPRWLRGEALVSGDTNPRNWAVRDDGSVVLLDWERVGVASPAVDVAVTVPGLGSPDDLAAVAAGYARAGGATLPVEALATVKAWTATELLAQERTEALAGVQDHLVRALPEWLAGW